MLIRIKKLFLNAIPDHKLKAFGHNPKNLKITDESSSTLLAICIACAKMCYANAAKCKEMEGMEDCFHICINCADVCLNVISELRGNPGDLINAVTQCVHICGECAKEFAKYDNNHCRKCSEICLKCAEICTRILEQEIALKPVQQVA